MGPATAPFKSRQQNSESAHVTPHAHPCSARWRTVNPAVLPPPLLGARGSLPVPGGGFPSGIFGGGTHALFPPTSKGPGKASAACMPPPSLPSALFPAGGLRAPDPRGRSPEGSLGISSAGPATRRRSPPDSTEVALVSGSRTSPPPERVLLLTLYRRAAVGNNKTQTGFYSTVFIFLYSPQTASPRVCPPSADCAPARP